MAQAEDCRMSSTLELKGIASLLSKLESLKDLNAADLMESWEETIAEDNREGVLAGLNKDGVPMFPVSYRPRQPGPYRVGAAFKRKGVKETNAMLKRFRLNQRRGLKRGRFEGASPIGPGWVERNNNLRSSEYRLLGGPPLAPRDQYSRVISNLATDHKRVSEHEWVAWGEWKEVISVQGVPFLPFLFARHNWDLRGVRPDGIIRAVEALHNWARLAVREHLGR
jgi:hypothetical protein